MNNNNELISIIIPVYNTEKYINKCINSLVNQTYKNIEIILIDDGSKDRSGEICDNFLKMDHRIKVLHNENKGVSNARNLGIKIAKGNYICFVDSDDYIDPYYIETLYNLCKHSQTDLVICGVKDEDLNGNIIKESNEIKKKLNKMELLKELLNEHFFYGVCWAKLYKRKIIGNNRFNEDMKIGEDFEFLYRIIQNTNFAYMDTTKKLYHFLIHDGSATKKGFNEQWKKEIEFCENIIDDISKYEKNIEVYAIKRFFRVVMSCIIVSLKSNGNNADIKYLRNKLIRYRKNISRNSLITLKQKFFFYIIIVNPNILKVIFKIKKRLVRKKI